MSHLSIQSCALSLGFALLLIMGFSPSTAQAQGHAERQAAVAAEHAARMNDIAATRPEGQPESGDGGAGGDRGSYYTDFGPSRAFVPLTPEQIALIAAVNRDREMLEAAEADSRLQRNVGGAWEHFRSRAPAEPGEYCAATYRGPRGFITLSGADKSSDVARFMFVGRDIPTPAAVERVTATLSQTGTRPATVQAFLFAANPGMEGYGTMVFEKPSIQDALAAMIEESEFVVEIEGRQVFRMSYRDGRRARDELRRCMSQR